MSRTRKKCSLYSYERDTKFHYKQKCLLGCRKREFIDYEQWDAPGHSRHSLEAYRIIKRLVSKGYDVEEILRHLRKRYNINQDEARRLLPYYMYRNDDFTKKKK